METGKIDQEGKDEIDLENSDTQAGDANSFRLTDFLKMLNRIATFELVHWPLQSIRVCFISITPNFIQLCLAKRA